MLALVTARCDAFGVSHGRHVSGTVAGRLRRCGGALRRSAGGGPVQAQSDRGDLRHRDRRGQVDLRVFEIFKIFLMEKLMQKEF